MNRASAISQTRVLRRLFLTMMMRGRRQKYGKPRRIGPWVGFSLSLFLFAAVGGLAFALPLEPFLFAGSLHSLAFVLVGLNLATTSGQLLFNPEEAEVLLHRPIEPRALLSAKLQTIGFVSLALAIALNLCGLVLGAWRLPAGWLFIPAHLISLTLEVLFASGFIVLAYNLCLRWFGRERLDNLMTSVQMLAAVGIMAGGQIVPRLLRGLDFAHLAVPHWMWIFPPIWFAALDLVLCGRGWTGEMLLPAAVGLVTTFAVVWLGAVRLSATYELGLESLNETAPTATRAGGLGRGFDRLRRLPGMRWWLRDPVESAAFRLTLANLARSRGVKLRVYPMLAQMLVMPVVMLIGGGGGGRQALNFIEPYLVAYLGFFLAMLPVLALEALRLSEDYEAAEFFRQAPLGRPSALFHGTRKAAMTALCLPMLLIVLTAGAFLLTDKRELVLVAPGLVSMHLFSLLPTLFRLFVPFAEPVENVSRSMKTTAIILFFQLFSIALAGLFGWTWTHWGFWWLLLGEVGIVWLVSLGLQTTIAMRGFPVND